MTPTYAFPITPTLTPTIDPNAPVTIDSNDAQVSLNGAWQTVENPQANGGSYLISGTADDSMGLIFEGTAISIIYLQHPAMGSFNVEIDGTMMGSVRETGDILLFRQVPITGLTPGLHTLRLIPAQSPIVIDAFVVNPPANWLPGMIVTATLPPTLEITLTPTASWTYSPTPDIVADTLTPSPIIVPTDVVETWTPSPTYIVVTETWTPTPTPSELPTWTPTLETPIWTETPTEIPIETSTSIPVSTTEEVSG